jgi:GTP-binding protein
MAFAVGSEIYLKRKSFMFTLAIVGRPNVGKSTLYNRLTGTKFALVDDQPGVTRDRRYGEGRISSLHFHIIDTAGMEEQRDKEALGNRMLAMTKAGIEEADVALMVVDGLAGITPEDEYFARWLRKLGKPVVLVVNKAESKHAAPAMPEAYRLGLGDPVAISAVHGEGMSDLYEALLPFDKHDKKAEKADEWWLAGDEPEAEETEEQAAERIAKAEISLAIIGRPNAGKSTLMNAMLKQDRVLTGPEAGLTRDAIAVQWSYQNRPIRLIDTAGLRRQSRRQEKLERLSASDSFRSIQYANVVVLLLDATCPLDKQDLILADHVVEEGRALIIAVNKWDLVTAPQAWLTVLHQMLEKRLSGVRGVPLITLSAQRGQGIAELMAAVFQVYTLWNRRIPTGQLNRWLEGMIASNPPPLSASKRPIKLKYMTQIKTRPPSFILFATRKENLPESYRRYLVQGLREAFELPAIPIRLQLRGSKNPFVDE